MRQRPQMINFEEKGEPKWGIEPMLSAYQPDTLPPSQAGLLMPAVMLRTFLKREPSEDASLPENVENVKNISIGWLCLTMLSLFMQQGSSFALNLISLGQLHWFAVD